MEIWKKGLLWGSEASWKKIVINIINNINIRKNKHHKQPPHHEDFFCFTVDSHDSILLFVHVLPKKVLFQQYGHWITLLSNALLQFGHNL